MVTTTTAGQCSDRQRGHATDASGLLEPILMQVLQTRTLPAGCNGSVGKIVHSTQCPLYARVWNTHCGCCCVYHLIGEWALTPTRNAERMQDINYHFGFPICSPVTVIRQRVGRSPVKGLKENAQCMLMGVLIGVRGSIHRRVCIMHPFPMTCYGRVKNALIQRAYRRFFASIHRATHCRNYINMHYTKLIASYSRTHCIKCNHNHCFWWN